MKEDKGWGDTEYLWMRQDGFSETEALIESDTQTVTGCN